MAPKTKASASKSSAKEAKGKDEAKAEKPGKKGAKAAQAPEPAEAPVAAEGAVDPDEIEEAEDAAAASSSGGGNEAALAAASSSGEMSASFKNFRHHPDMENFYRFIYENDLRHEALAIIDEIMVDKANRRAGAKQGGKGAH